MGRANFPINFRAFFVIALSVTVSVFGLYVYLFNSTAGIVFICVFASAVAGVTVKFAIGFVRKRTGLTKTVAFALALCFSVCAFAVGSVSANEWNASERFSGHGSVTGRVCALDTRNGKYKISLDSLAIDGNKTAGILSVTLISDGDGIEELADYGDILSFAANIEFNELLENGKVNGAAYRSGVRYTAHVHASDVLIEFGEPRLIEKMLSGLRDLYVRNMGELYGNIAFSMLTGDKNMLSADVTDYFSAVGLGHIMAVSGLHIGFMIMALNFILMRVKKKIRFPIIFAVIMGYAVIADFSPSVVRATIMAVVSGAALIFGRRRDLFSSLCCAFSLILAFKPFYLFEAGFLLSFGAIFGIAVFANTIKCALVKRGAHNKVGGAVGASVSVAVGILPSEICFFGSVQLLSIILNAVIMPYISLVFISLVCLTPIAAIPGLGAALTVCRQLLSVLDYLAYGLAQFPYATLPLRVSALVYLCYPLMFCASDLFMVKRNKWVVTVYSAVCCAAIVAVCVL